MKIKDIIESIELSFDGYSKTIEVQGRNYVTCRGQYLAIAVSTPFELYDYPLDVDDSYIEIDSMKGTIDRVLTICIESIDIMTGQVIVRIVSDEFQAAEITECSDKNYSLAEITEDVNKAFANNDLLHGEEGLEVSVNIDKRFIIDQLTETQF